MKDTIEKKINPTWDQLCFSIAISNPIYINLHIKQKQALRKLFNKNGKYKYNKSSKTGMPDLHKSFSQR